jgi:hypothetical protein
MGKEWIVEANTTANLRKISVPEGRLKVIQDFVAALFSRPYGTGASYQTQPRTASWAKVSRPYGTQHVNLWFSRTLFSPHRSDDMWHG